MFALLFGGAGTFAWPEAWLYMIIQSSSSALMVVWLKKHNPALLKTRTELWKRMAKPWDKAIMILLTASIVPLFAVPGLDAVRYGWSHVPLPLKIIGFIGVLIGSGLIFEVIKTNPYSSGAVEIQRDRGHKVVTTGPYEFVRHPM
jgi:protein-S-isoprenylcysteine O-methyltransferase Ste14